MIKINKTTSQNKLGQHEDTFVPVSQRTVNGYFAQNSEKWNRAVYGTIGANGALTGGVGEDAASEAKLVEYDKLGGLILKGNRKIKTGSFYDFHNKKAVEEPKPVFVFRIDEEEIEVPVGEEIPVEIQAAEIAQTKKSEKTLKVKALKKVKPTVEDEE